MPPVVDTNRTQVCMWSRLFIQSPCNVGHVRVPHPEAPVVNSSVVTVIGMPCRPVLSNVARGWLHVLSTCGRAHAAGANDAREGCESCAHAAGTNDARECCESFAYFCCDAAACLRAVLTHMSCACFQKPRNARYASEEAVERWHDLKFGLRIHWLVGNFSTSTLSAAAYIPCCDACPPW